MNIELVAYELATNPGPSYSESREIKNFVSSLGYEVVMPKIMIDRA